MRPIPLNHELLYHALMHDPTLKMSISRRVVCPPLYGYSSHVKKGAYHGDGIPEDLLRCSCFTCRRRCSRVPHPCSARRCALCSCSTRARSQKSKHRSNLPFYFIGYICFCIEPLVCIVSGRECRKTCNRTSIRSQHMRCHISIAVPGNEVICHL